MGVSNRKTDLRAHNNCLQNQIAILWEIIQQNEIVYEVLSQAPSLGLPNSYVGAGCITQTVWNALCGIPLMNNIKDIDLVYFDATDLSEESERAIQMSVNEKFRGTPIRIDVKNEARVHLWYEQEFGYAIRPYESCEDAINTWPTSATSIGLTMNSGQDVYAPFGLNDLFGLVVRANKAQITEEIFLTKVRRWQQHWPELSIVPWNDTPTGNLDARTSGKT